MKTKQILLVAFTAFGMALSTYAQQLKVGNNPTNITANTNFEVEATDGSKVVVKKANSNVGIGTTVPTHKLVLLKDAMAMPTYSPSTNFSARFIGSTAANAISVENYSSAADAISSILGMTANGTSTAPTAIINNQRYVSLESRGFDGTTMAPTGHISFFATENHSATGSGNAIGLFTVANGTKTPTEKMRIDHNGNVGIGTTSPGSKLHLNADNGNGLLLQKGSIYYNWFIADNFNNANYGSNAADYVGNGFNNVCVRNFPGGGMHVFGDNVSPWATAQYDLGTTFARWQNIFLTNSPNVSSDARLKSQVSALPYGLETIMRLSPKSYDKYSNFEKTGTYNHELGFIAQDLQKIIPEAITGSPSDKIPMGVMYEQLIPVLTKAIQDLKKEVDALKAELIIVKTRK